LSVVQYGGCQQRRDASRSPKYSGCLLERLVQVRRDSRTGAERQLGQWTEWRLEIGAGGIIYLFIYLFIDTASSWMVHWFASTLN
jgi:hypothetical protein